VSSSCAPGVSARRLFAFALCGTLLSAEEAIAPVFRSDVDLVTVSFTVTDSRGSYIRDLKAADIRILEDGVEQRIATFTGLSNVQAEQDDPSPVENNVFVLLSSSNAMYEDFMHASDTVADFVRSVSSRHGVAVYTFSRNLYRASPLSRNVSERVQAIRSNVVGDDTAVFNSLLLTVRDAAKVPGNKSIVLLSNGPDTASMVSPDDVARVAQEEGIPVHVVYTDESDKLMDVVLRRIAAGTGGRAHVARSWDEQKAAFNLIGDELMNSYTLAYYPRPSENEGFRRIAIEIVSDTGRKYRVRARPGYKPARYRPAPPPCWDCRIALASPGSLDR
jgi:VWFA-related protein